MAALEAAVCAHAGQLVNARRVWVGFSGGADSTALLLALVRGLPELDVWASHINHGTQPQANTWVRHCESVCQTLGVPLDIAELEPPADQKYPQGFEAWAREKRYAHWQTLVAETDVLLLGHHATDQQETVALRLLQGRLPLPMPSQRPLGGSSPGGQACGTLLRPFLHLPAALMPVALERLGQSWVQDPSNTSRAMLRNRLRHDLLPVLNRETTGGWLGALERCGRLTEALVQAFDARFEPPQPTATGELLQLPLTALENPAAVQALLQRIVPGIAESQVRSALASLQRQLSSAPGSSNRNGVALASGLGLWAADSALILWREPKTLAPKHLRLDDRGRGQVQLEQGSLRISGEPGLKLLLSTATALVAPRQLVFGGRRQKVRELLRAHGVPRWARDSYPLLLSFEEPSRLLGMAVYGATESEGVKRPSEGLKVWFQKK